MLANGKKNSNSKGGAILILSSIFGSSIWSNACKLGRNGNPLASPSSSKSKNVIHYAIGFLVCDRHRSLLKFSTQITERPAGRSITMGVAPVVAHQHRLRLYVPNRRSLLSILIQSSSLVFIFIDHYCRLCSNHHMAR